MGILDAAFDAFGGTLEDQWKDIVTAADFDEHTFVTPGIRKRNVNGRGNDYGAECVLTNGSMIYVPEGTAAFVFSQGGIEQIIVNPGGYEYRNGQATVFDARDRQETGIGKALFGQAAQRLGFSGISPDEKRIAFVNMHEVRGIRFGTRGPLVYNDRFYGCDLEVFSYGTFSVKVIDPEAFIRHFVPANVSRYSANDPEARKQLTAEFLHSYIGAVNALSDRFRIAQLPGQANAISQAITQEDQHAATWPERFGLELVSVAIENIEFSEQSRELVHQYSERKMNVAAYEGVSQHAANVAAQQMIAQGVRENGFGDAGNMLFGMGFAGALNPLTAAFAGQAKAGDADAMNASQAVCGEQVGDSSASAGATDSNDSGAGGGAKGCTDRPAAVASLDEQIETVKKLKELLDAGILTQEEFDKKKHEIMSL